VGNNRGSQTEGQRANIKNYSHDILLKETEQWSKGSRTKKAPRCTKKGMTLTLCSNLELAVGDEDEDEDEDVDE
jgi:hypothetical protein